MTVDVVSFLITLSLGAIHVMLTLSRRRLGLQTAFMMRLNFLGRQPKGTSTVNSIWPPDCQIWPWGPAVTQCQPTDPLVPTTVAPALYSDVRQRRTDDSGSRGRRTTAAKSS